MIQKKLEATQVKAKKVGKQKIILMFVAIIIALALIVTVTQAAFSARATSVGTVVFDNGITVTSTVTNPIELRGGLSSTEFSGSSPYKVSENTYRNFNTTISGEWTVSGSEQMTSGYIGWSLEFRYLTTNVESDRSADNLLCNQNWVVYPMFNAGFGYAMAQDNYTGFADTDYTFFRNITLNGTSYKLVVAKPICRALPGNGYYSKTYNIYVTDVNFQPVRVPLATPITINFSDIISSVFYKTDGTSNYGIASIMAGGRIEMHLTCRASIYSFTDI